MPIAAHRCTLLYGAGNFGLGTLTLNLVSGTTYTVPAPFKNIISFVPGSTHTITDGGVSIGSAFSTDYLAAQVTLNSPPAGAVQIVGASYMLLNPALEVKEFTLSLTRDELEATIMGDTAKEFILGLRGGTGSIGGLDILSTLFLNSGGQTQSIQSIHEGDLNFVLSVVLNPDSNKAFRAFVKIPSLELSGARDGLVEANFPFTISEVSAPANSTGKASWSMFTLAP